MAAAQFIARKLFAAAVVVFLTISFSFVLFQAAPGSPTEMFARVPGASPQLRQSLLEEFGLDRSLGAQYVSYLDQLAHGNLGISFGNRQPVADRLRDALGATVPMVGAGVLVAILLGTLTGVLAAGWRGRPMDHGLVGLGALLYGLPVQWVGVMLVLVFANILPTSGRVDEFLVDPGWLQHQLDVLKHMALPSLSLGIVLFGQYTLLVRSAMLETFSEDYILTARAKGLSAWRTIRRHALPNAMLPTVTLVGLSVGSIVGGAVLTETVFSWPGVGMAIEQAVLQRDYPMLQGAFLVIALSVVLSNLVVELLYLRLDPRVRS